jgi:hypothetical protein
MRDSVVASTSPGKQTRFGKPSAWRCGILVVLLTATVGMSLALQGWKSRIPSFDLVTYVHSTRDFLATGTFPQHGDTGSYGNFKPPGTAWLMVPSALLFADPRLSEYVGTGILYVVGLIGIFLLARFFFGVWCACFSVVLYGLSQHGLFFAGSLWPNGRPEFYIWIVYFTTLWVSRRDSKYLAFAGTVWAIGMHVDMAIAPAFFVFLALWMFYRPPVRAASLMIGAILALIVWYPYLRFESSRKFVDVKSMLLLEDIRPANYIESWCNPGLTLQAWKETRDPRLFAVSTPVKNSRNRLAQLVNSRIIVPATKLPSNFQPAYLAERATFGLATSLVLLLLTLISIIALTGPRFLSRAADVIGAPNWLGRLGLSMILVSLIANEFLIALYLSVDGMLEPATVSGIRWLQGIMLVTGTTVLILRKQFAPFVARMLSSAAQAVTAVDLHANVKPLTVSLLVPWLILLIVAEPGKPERFWWLWPLQIIFLAAFVTHFLSRIRRARPVTFLTFGFIMLAVLYNPLVLSRVGSWIESGWTGGDAPEIQTIDYLASQLRSHGRDRAAIGYQMFIYPFMAEYNVANPQYKVGADFDLLLKYRHGIVNTNACAEGISANDEYRVVQTQPKQEEWRPRQYFAISPDRGFRLLRHFELYQIFKRMDPSVATYPADNAGIS